MVHRPRYLLNKYDLWSRYEPEDKAVMIAYDPCMATQRVAQVLAKELCERGVTNVVVYDVSQLMYRI